MLRDTVQRIKQSGLNNLASTQWIMNPRNRFAILQWFTIIIVAALLSGDVLLISSASGLLLPVLLTLVTFAILGAVILGSTGYLRKMFLVAVLMDIPFQVDYHLNFNERVAKFGSIGGFNISVTLIGLVILYIWWFVDVLSKRTAPPSRTSFRLTRPLFAYFTVVVLSIFVASNVDLAVFEIDLLVQATLLYFYIIHVTRTDKDVLFIIMIFFITIVPFSLLAIYLSFTGGFDPTAASAASRSGGPLGEPNVAASYLMMVLITVFSTLTVPQVGRWYKRIAALSVGLGGVALLVTGSRGGWGGLALAMTIFCWLAWRQGWLSLKIPAAYIIIALCAALPFYEPILNRLSGDKSAATAESRDPLNQLAALMIQDNPLTGVGANNFAWNLPKYVNSEFTNLWINTVHNKYLLVWAETGILGLATYIWFLAASIYLGWQAWKRYDRQISPFALAFALALMGAAMHMTVAQYHDRAQLQMIALAAGVTTAIYKMKRSENVEDASVTQKTLSASLFASHNSKAGEFS